LEQFCSGAAGSERKPEELVTRIDLPRVRGKTGWSKYARREANAPSVVSVAARIVTDPEGVVSEARIALGGANKYPMRGKNAEAALTGRILNAESIADAADAAIKDASPFSDALASEWYRRKMVGVYVKRVLGSII
jgi:CO/xanthine dehydrogenase FAD-binding subunit